MPVCASATGRISKESAIADFFGLRLADTERVGSVAARSPRAKVCAEPRDSSGFFQPVTQALSVYGVSVD
jgi:hypothetical protein